ncbi:MAG: methionyl-tRNA formyltransferase [Candidatus Marinimicrobia bacterium]|nr:methionyl-tRNA formyltransferase [Candidatus Neomarinimicrobiota bacterium]
MKIIFMGTPRFALPSLEAIFSSRHVIKAVVTGEDVKRGRGLRMQEPPVKTLAISLGLSVIQPTSLKSTDLIQEMKSFSPDIFVVVAFKILPKVILEVPKKGSINLHASILPKYRGAAPINWAIINGDKETGISIFQIKPKVDTGDILLQRYMKIQPDDTAGSLAEKLSVIGAEAIVEVLDGMEKGEMTAIPQDDKLATAAPKIFPELCIIDWNKDATFLKDLIRGLSPAPGAYSFFKKRRIKILAAAVSESSFHEEPGTIVLRDKKQLGIQTGNGLLSPREIQVEGRKPLGVEDFLRGFQGKIGEKFISPEGSL